MPRAVNNIAKAQAFGLAWRPAHTVVDAAASPPSPSAIHPTRDDERIAHVRSRVTPPPSSRACVDERDGQIYIHTYHTYIYTIHTLTERVLQN